MRRGVIWSDRCRR